MQVLSVVFFAAVGIQLIYLFVFLYAFKRKRIAKQASGVPVSVIVCAHDEEQNLKELVPLLLDQDYDEFEVIIVNDRSNDGTYDYLLEETKKHGAKLRMVHVDKTPSHVNGKKFGITLGIKAATHEWILLTDADCRPQGREWIKSMASQFEQPAQFVLGVSPYKTLPGFLNLFIRFESLLTAVQYLSFGLLKNPYMGVGRNLAYRKSLFLEKKGFNNILHVTGGDDDLFVNQYAKGGTTNVQFIAESQVYSIPENTWKGFYYQKIRHLAVGKRYQGKHRILLGIFSLTWIITWFTGIPLIALDYQNYWISGLLVFRIIILTAAIHTAVHQMGLSFKYWLMPVLDFLYSIYYLSTGLVALTTKKIRWRN